MSRLPHPDGVAEVVKLLADVDALDAEAEKLRPMALRLKEVDEQLGKLHQKLPGLLSAMDVESPGNFGWERRMGWFISEMRRQIMGVKS